ncbi:MAG TPA: hypothetical protein VGL18_06640 [Actinomycetota bacterium]
MAEQPPPVPPPPGQAPGERPGVVTAAAVLLIIGGVLGILVGILLLSGAGAARGRGAGGLFTFVGLVSMAVGAVQTFAGVQVLNLREIGRTLGIAIAAVSAVFSLLSVGRAPGAILTILIDLFIIYALTQNKQYFTA